jgi:hypothetical protein
MWGVFMNRNGAEQSDSRKKLGNIIVVMGPFECNPVGSPHSNWKRVVLVAFQNRCL